MVARSWADQLPAATTTRSALSRAVVRIDTDAATAVHPESKHLLLADRGPRAFCAVCERLRQLGRIQMRVHRVERGTGDIIRQDGTRCPRSIPVEQLHGQARGAPARDEPRE